MLKTFFLNTIKILIAAGLIYWLISSGKLDFKLLMGLRNHLSAVLIAILLSLLNLILVSLRWETILGARSQVKLTTSELFKVSWIGQFFSSVLPGSVSGDLVKILYVQKIDKSFSKKFIFASILIDRVMGLCGLILLVGMSSILFGEKIVLNAPALAPLLKMNYVLTGVVLFSFILFLFFHDFIRYFLVKFESLAFKGILQKIISLWDDLVLIKSRILKAVGLSLLVQFFGVLSFWSLIQPSVDGQMNFIQALSFIPIGLMTLALPIAPSGLGVGHAIFQKLFELLSISNGASLFNLYFVVTLSVNLLGVIPYLMTKPQK
jgi:uncharacterized membrane protein YbhN (UPF0104 family)